MDNEAQWMNETMAAMVWPNPSANLHDRILAQTKAMPFTFKRPGLKLSTLALAAMAAGFCVGVFGQLPVANTHLASNSSPYYTGSGMLMIGMLEGRTE